MAPAKQRHEKGLLLIEIYDAIDSGDAERNPALHAQRLERLAVLNEAEWAWITTAFADLRPFVSFTEGVLHTAQRLALPLPPIIDEGPQPLGTPRGSIVAAWLDRSVQVFPFVNVGPVPYYAVDIFEAGNPYQGDAPTLEEVTRLMSAWLIERATITDLAPRHPWLRVTPVQVGWRMRLEGSPPARSGAEEGDGVDNRAVP